MFQIFMFRRETAVGFLFFSENSRNFIQKWSTFFCRIEAVEFLLFAWNTSNFNFSGTRSHRLSIFPLSRPSIFTFQRFLKLQFQTKILTSLNLFPSLHQAACTWVISAVCCSSVWHGTQLYAVHDQGSKTGRTFTADCCNRRRSKHATVSCAVNFVNCLQPVSVCILMENVLIYFVGWGVVCFVSFQVPLTSCASPWRADGTKNDVRSK